MLSLVLLPLLLPLLLTTGVGPLPSPRALPPLLPTAGEMTLSREEQKRKAGRYVVDTFVQSGMLLGLGTGSTAAFAVERIAEKLKSGELKDIVGIPTSEATRQQALSLGVPLTSLDERSDIAVAIDGADEVDLGEGEEDRAPSLALIKGLGGALLREKMVERCAKRFVVVADSSKGHKGLGVGKLPVEVVRFGHRHLRRELLRLPSLQGKVVVAELRQKVGATLSGADNDNEEEERGDDDDEERGEEGRRKKAREERRRVREEEGAYITDNGNFVIDLSLSSVLDDPQRVASELLSLPGVVEHGLFLRMCHEFVSCDAAGQISVYRSSRAREEEKRSDVDETDGR